VGVLGPADAIVHHSRHGNMFHVMVAIDISAAFDLFLRLTPASAPHAEQHQR